MKLLNYQTLKEQEYDGYLLKEAPERVLSSAREIFCVHLPTVSSTR